MVADIVLYTLLVPVLLALAFHGAGFAAHGAQTVRGAVAPGLAAIGALLSVAIWIRGIPDFPPSGSNAWFFVITVFAGALAVVESRLKHPARWVLRLALLAGGLRMLLDAKFQADWDASTGLVVVAGLTALGLTQWFSLERLSTRHGGPVFGLVLAAYAGFSAAIMGLASSASLAQTAGAGALAALITAAVAWKLPVKFESLITALVPTTLALLTTSHYYADLPLSGLLLTASLPLITWVGELGPWASRTALRALTHFLVMLAPIAGVGWLLVQPTPPNPTTTPTPSAQSAPTAETPTPAAEEPYDPYAAGGNDPDYDPYKK